MIPYAEPGLLHVLPGIFIYLGWDALEGVLLDECYFRGHDSIEYVRRYKPVGPISYFLKRDILKRA